MEIILVKCGKEEVGRPGVDVVGIGIGMLVDEENCEEWERLERRDVDVGSVEDGPVEIPELVRGYSLKNDGTAEGGSTEEQHFLVNLKYALKSLPEAIGATGDEDVRLCCLVVLPVFLGERNG